MEIFTGIVTLSAFCNPQQINNSKEWYQNVQSNGAVLNPR
jgi:hypothetical protein